MKALKRITLLTLLASSLIYATPSFAINGSPHKSKYNIEILYTNDVHCFVDNNIGYSGLIAYKKEMLAQTPYIALVDSGDHLQGNVVGSISKGQFIVDIMNKAKYDFATIGNHEFDYGLDILRDRLEKSKTKYLACNVEYTGELKNPFATTIPFAIKRFGTTKVAFIGVVTPKSIGSSKTTNFIENKKIVVDLKGGNDGKDLFDTVQNTVNTCISEGANYIVILSHLGTNNSLAPFTSKFLIANTTGIDVVLDAHSHSIIPKEIVQNKNGKDVILTSTGTALEKIGRLTISNNGINSELISGYTPKDKSMTDFIDQIKNKLGDNISKEIGYSNTPLNIANENGARLVRNRETNIGNWVSDAIALTAKTEIALFNGGGIRASLKSGKITIGDIYALHTFNNTLVKYKITGEKLLKVLESSYKTVSQKAIGEDGAPLNESGSFLQVSGLKIIIDTSIKAGEGKSRIQEVLVKEKGKYQPLDLNKEYLVAAPDYITGNSEGKIPENSVVEEFGIIPESLVDYFKLLEGNLSNYSNIEGRIIIK